MNQQPQQQQQPQKPTQILTKPLESNSQQAKDLQQQKPATTENAWKSQSKPHQQQQQQTTANQQPLMSIKPTPTLGLVGAVGQENKTENKSQPPTTTTVATTTSTTTTGAKKSSRSTQERYQPPPAKAAAQSRQQQQQQQQVGKASAKDSGSTSDPYHQQQTKQIPKSTINTVNKPSGGRGGVNNQAHNQYYKYNVSLLYFHVYEIFYCF